MLPKKKERPEKMVETSGGCVFSMRGVGRKEMISFSTGINEVY